MGKVCWGGGAEGGGRGGVVAAKEEASTEVVAAGEAIDPGHGVLVGAVGGVGEVEEFGEVPEAELLGVQEGGGDGAELEFGAGDEPSEAESADGCTEPIGVLFAAAEASGSVGSQEFEGADVAGEGAGAVVVFAVDVVGDRAADGDEAGAGGHGEKPTRRNAEAEDRVEAAPGLAVEAAGGGVERNPAVEPAGHQQAPAVVEAGVAIAPAESVGEDRGGGGQGAAPPREGKKGVGGLGQASPGFHGAVHAFSLMKRGRW